MKSLPTLPRRAWLERLSLALAGALSAHAIMLSTPRMFTFIRSIVACVMLAPMFLLLGGCHAAGTAPA